MNEVNKMFRKLKQWKYKMEAKLAIFCLECRLARKCKCRLICKLFQQW